MCVVPSRLGRIMLGNTGGPYSVPRDNPFYGVENAMDHHQGCFFHPGWCRLGDCEQEVGAGPLSLAYLVNSHLLVWNQHGNLLYCFCP